MPRAKKFSESKKYFLAMDKAKSRTDAKTMPATIDGAHQPTRETLLLRISHCIMPTPTPAQIV
ncbi:MAG: hypothetical protein WBA71_01220 [Candidatus Humimicrobiia bacterium]